MPKLAIVLNYLYFLISFGAAVWVFIVTGKRGRPLSESIAWALFMGFMLPLAIITYLYFRRKNLV